MRFAMVPLLVAFLFRCAPQRDEASNPADESAQGGIVALQQAHEEMVRDQIAARGVHDARVLAALRDVPRHFFVPPEMLRYAYADTPLPIGYGQTISQPYVVAFMTEALEPKPDDRVLEIGTGSGYQAAVLARLCRDVYSMEIVEPLAREAAERLERLGYANIHLRTGDGYRGWPEAAPFDGIIVTAAPEKIPQALLEQLRVGGRMIVPVGRGDQTLVRIRRTPKGFAQESLMLVRFVPMVSEDQAVEAPRR
jgi:protein-L-isoaspartate(D-aspartate) O-methyltransferase